jgi:hypothetical protein
MASAALALSLKETAETLKHVVDSMNAPKPVNFPAPSHAFRGTADEDGDRFIEQFKLRASLGQWTEQAIRCNFAQILEGPAYDWFKAAVLEKDDLANTMDMWSLVFKSKFGKDKAMTCTEARMILQSFCQGSSTVEDYARRFEHLAYCHNSSMHDQDKIMHFIKGLRPELKIKVVEKNAQDYETAKQAARLYENVELQLKTMTPTAPSAVASTIDLTVVTALHQLAERMTKWETEQKAQVSTVAEVDSIQQYQRRPSRQQDGNKDNGGGRYNNGGSGRSNRGNSDFFDGWCSYCNKYGHRQSDCRKKKREMGNGGGGGQQRPQWEKKRQYDGDQQQQQQRTYVHVVDSAPPHKVVKTEDARSVADSRIITLTDVDGTSFRVAVGPKNF